MEIIQAQEQHMDMVRELFREYQAWLDNDICFQGFEAELANLPGSYAAPRGAIYLAFADEEVVACSAIKPRSDKYENNEAELKRLYVKRIHRGHGLGRDMFNTAMFGASEMGYASVVLETLAEKMEAAQCLYRDYGFRPIPNYRKNFSKGNNKDTNEGVECYFYSFDLNA